MQTVQDRDEETHRSCELRPTRMMTRYVPRGPTLHATLSLQTPREVARLVISVHVPQLITFPISRWSSSFEWQKVTRRVY